MTEPRTNYGGWIAGAVLGVAAIALVAFGRDGDARSVRFAVLSLVLVGSALVGCACYAVFRHPKNQRGRNRKERLISGFRLAGGILFGIALMAILIGCFQIACGIVQSTKLSRFAAALVALAAVGLILVLIEHWARHFAGWVGYSVWNGLLMVSSGHLVNNPSIPVARSFAIALTAIALVSALVTVRFGKKYILNRLDKAGLMLWVLAFVASVSIPESIGLIVMSVACVILVGAWWYQRHQRTRRHHVIPAKDHGTASSW